MRLLLYALCSIGLACGAAFAQTPIPARASAHLAQADANSDGMITRREFMRYRAAQFDQLDRNEDGVLSAADRMWGPLRFAGGQEALIETFDANGDGFITRVEFIRAPTPAFDAADRNGDRVLSQSELQAARAAGRR